MPASRDTITHQLQIIILSRFMNLGLGSSVGSRRVGNAPGQGFQKGAVQGGGFPNSRISRFLLPASEGAYIIHLLLEELETDQWPVAPSNRSLRCTRVALSVAAGLLRACMPGTGARIVALVGGPCTEGPGSIVSKDLSNPVRSHKDLYIHDTFMILGVFSFIILTTYSCLISEDSYKKNVSKSGLKLLIRGNVGVFIDD
ncbi:hypothetical protein L2E82_37771 [Cichorium intybus]|uniref:Uncharacterized protein n=1 Tax=Cichorium intybus TaxID=13427 RepID=A0ACB9AJD7_CICIN|nr:hypothetical protein L2E82_37771 [Cichorium intybus]